MPEPEETQEIEPPTTSSVDWKQYDLGDFDGKDMKEVANQIKQYKHFAGLHGKQSQELGQLRKEREQWQAEREQLQRMKEAAGQKVEPTSDWGDWNDQKRQQFFFEIENGNPLKYIHDSLNERFSKQFVTQEMIAKQVQEMLQNGFDGYTDWMDERHLMSDPEYVKYKPYIEVLQQDVNFGKTRTKSDLLEFAKFRATEQDENLVGLVYDLMRKYPSMDLTQAKKWAGMELQTSRQADTNADDLRQKVNAVKDVTGKGAATKASETEKVATMDEAFE